MGIIKKMFANTRKPQGMMGKLMAGVMNGTAHTALARWGLSHIELSGSEQVLDCGCGGGGNVRRMLTMLPAGRVAGLDYSDVSVQKARQVNRKSIENGRCRIVKGNVLKMNFRSALFDLVTAFETVYFWPGIEDCFREVHRVLRPGGRFLIVNEADGKHQASLRWADIIDGMRVYTGEELAEALRAAGFCRIDMDADAEHDRLTVVAYKTRSEDSEDTVEVSAVSDEQIGALHARAGVYGAPSLKYRLIRKAFIAMGYKDRFKKSPDELLAKAAEKAAKVRVPSLSHPDLDIIEKEFQGSRVVYILHKSPTEVRRRACLFLIGGGMIMYPRPASLKKAMKIALDTGRDMIVPYYPLCLDHTVDQVYDWVYDLYRNMLRTYDAGRIMVTGSSSGANLAIGLIAHINARGEEVPMPEKIYAASPGECFRSDEVRRRAEELNATDVAIDAKYMSSAEEIMTKGKEVPPYMLYLEDGSYQGLKEVYLCYGSDEVLYAACELILGALERDGVRVTLEVGPGMYHCYPFIPLVPEAQAGWDTMIEYHK